MSDESPETESGTGNRCDVEAVCTALADADARRVLATLETPLTAKEVEQRCDLPRTTAYRRLEQLSEAGLVSEDIQIREDGHHTTRYVRDASDVVVTLDDPDGFAVDVRDDAESGADSTSDPVDERIAARWSQVREEL